MKTIVYRVTYVEGWTRHVLVEARSINSGFAKAISEARQEGDAQARLAPVRVRANTEISSIEFWEVR